MVIQRNSNSRLRQGAGLMVELLVAIALVIGALLPIAYSFGTEKRLTRALYERTIAMEIVYGELEVLAAGEWQILGPGSHELHPTCAAITNLPAGKFVARIATNSIRVEWISAKDHARSIVTREFAIGEAQSGGAKKDTP